MTTETASKPVTAPALNEKFMQCFDGGEIEVPENYVHETWLSTFQRDYHRRFINFHSSIKDGNFRRPSRILLPKERLHFRSFGHSRMGDTCTSEEWTNFLVTQNALFTGPQGLALVFALMGDRLPKSKHYASMDEKERLHRDQVPDLNCRSDGVFFMDLNNYNTTWYGGYQMICLNEI